MTLSLAIAFFDKDGKLNLLQISFKLSKVLLQQPIIQNSMKLPLYILLFTWVLTASFITRAFQSILLNIYYKSKPELTVYTLEDIVDKPDLLIAGSEFLKNIEEIKPDIYKNIEPRVKSYEKEMDIDFKTTGAINSAFYSDQVVRDVINRKAVLLVNSYQRKLFKIIYQNHLLLESDVKYGQTFLYSTVNKSIPYSYRISKM